MARKHRRIEKALSIALTLIIAFFANEWLGQAIKQPTEVGKWAMVTFTAILLTIAIYFSLDDEGKF